MIKALPQSVASDKKIARFFNVYKGPYSVERAVNTVTYLVVDTHGKERGKFHVSNLKPYILKIRQAGMNNIVNQEILIAKVRGKREIIGLGLGAMINYESASAKIIQTIENSRWRK